MSKQNSPREHGGRTVEMKVMGNPVTLQFPEYPDMSVSKRVREALIDSFIQKYAVKPPDD